MSGVEQFKPSRGALRLSSLPLLLGVRLTGSFGGDADARDKL
jgi:hypothetical protein